MWEHHHWWNTGIENHQTVALPSRNKQTISSEMLWLECHRNLWTNNAIFKAGAGVTWINCQGRSLWQLLRFIQTDSSPLAISGNDKIKALPNQYATNDGPKHAEYQRGGFNLWHEEAMRWAAHWTKGTSWGQSQTHIFLDWVPKTSHEYFNLYMNESHRHKHCKHYVYKAKSS